MSWFDKGFANLAKSALKEAQKQIDKALDIRDDDEAAALKTSETKERSSKTETPNTPVTDVNKRLAASTWGSFSGSFFENPNASEMVTAEPSATTQPNTPVTATTTTQPTSQAKRHSVTSNSDVELLSPSEAATPSEVNSVEVITSASEESSPAALCGTDSIVIIGSNEGMDEDEDSLSYSTVMDETLTAPTIASNLGASFEDTRDLSSCGSLTPRATVAQGNKKLLLSRDDIVIDSDSTQSFEDVQMVTATGDAEHAESVKDLSLDDKFDLTQMVMASTISYSSPHNSNDEIDTNTTTTSSDIEIISNPNGDSSSTHSATRLCPAKLKKLVSSGHAASAAQCSAASTSKKGHCREPSEISVLSEDSQTEIDKLTHRIGELTEQLEARDSQLLQCERQNAALHERNIELQTVVDSMHGNAANLDTSSDDYTQRLSALEKKFQASIRERDALRIQIQALKDDLRTKVPKDQLDQMTTERDAIIAELRLEGEKLSKEILQQSNIIKKLRAKEKTTDALLKKNKIQIDELTDETERLKKTLNAKEEVERSQIEAVHKMSSEKRKLEDENAQQCSKVEDLQMKLETMQASFDAVKDELQQRTRIHLDLTRTADEAALAKKQMEVIKAENQGLMLQMSELREKLRCSEQALTKREQQLREENKQLLSRLEAAELRAENSTQEVSMTTIPLMRQLESLQNTLSQRTANWNKEEKLLLEKLESTQTRLKSLEHVEVSFKDKIVILQTRCSDLEEKLSNALLQCEQATLALHQAQTDNMLKEGNFNRQITQLNEVLQEAKSSITLLETAKKSLEERLSHSNSQTSAATAAAAVKTATAHSSTDDLLQHKLSTSTTLHEIGSSRDQHVLQHQQSQYSQHSPANSSFDEAMGASFDWHGDDSDCISNPGGRPGLSLMGGLNFLGHNNTSTLEHLQSLLKQRDGELHHMQWEISRMQSERVVLNEEITNLTLELENLKEKLQTNESLETNFNELQHRYDELLQMYGEKVERTEELELDLYESREAYKKQIEELLSQPSSLRKST